MFFHVRDISATDFFPDVIWLGIAPMLMGMMQFMVHGKEIEIRC